MKTLDLVASDGTPVTLQYELPDSVRFNCFVPGFGVCDCYVDLRGDEIEVLDVVAEVDGGGESLPENRSRAEVLEQAGDVCAVFDDAGLMRTPHSKDIHQQDDLLILTAIADMAMHETELLAAWERLPGDVQRFCRRPSEGLAASRALVGFICGVLVDRAEELARKAALFRMHAYRKLEVAP